MHPIMPDMEWPTNTKLFKFISSTSDIRSLEKASNDEYLEASKLVVVVVVVLGVSLLLQQLEYAPEKFQSNNRTRHLRDKFAVILSHIDWSPPYPCARMIVFSPEPTILAFMEAEKLFSIFIILERE
ncbi:hypothetical protein ACLOJK_029271 [Asimina triloba]